MNWHPIETAPKDGTPIIVFGRERGEPRWVTAQWGVWNLRGDVDWRWVEGSDREDESIISFEPTHWASLDEPAE